MTVCTLFGIISEAKITHWASELPLIGTLWLVCQLKSIISKATLVNDWSGAKNWIINYGEYSLCSELYAQGGQAANAWLMLFDVSMMYNLFDDII